METGYVPLVSRASALRRRRSGPAFRLAVTAGLSLLAAGCVDDRAKPVEDTSAGPTEIEHSVAVQKTGSRDEVIRRTCSACHVFPQPRLLPKNAWRHEVEQAYEFIAQSDAMPSEIARAAEVLQYYERHAPDQIAIPDAPSDAAVAPRVTFVEKPHGPVELGGRAMAAAVQWIPSDSGTGCDCLVSDHATGSVLRWRRKQSEDNVQVLAQVNAPVHVERVDFNGDGFEDYLVADLGQFQPTNRPVGRVVCLQYDPRQAGYRTIELLGGIGRVADVRAADFDGDGDLDLVVAVFGWRTTGEVVYLENRPDPAGTPSFSPRTLDRRSGAIDVPVADLNGDGRLDFVTLFSQQHEQIVAFLGDGSGAFQSQTIFAADDPGYGSSGMRLVDLDADGDLDVLFTNGDLLDAGRLKPSHGVHWLENEGRFPFRHHSLLSLPGAHSPVAADLDGDGDLDIAAVTFLPEGLKSDRAALPSLVWLEQYESRRFRLHTLERGHCDHFALDVADFDGDGDPDLVTGNFALKEESTLRAARIAVWENRPAVP